MIRNPIEQTESGRQSEFEPGLAGSLSPCIITYRMVAPCDRCGRPASPVHMPRREHGLYCAECCPACSPARRNAANGKDASAGRS